MAFDLYQTITDKVIKAMETAESWRKPWAVIGYGMPRNFKTGKEYRGSNIFLLWLESEIKKYDIPVWGSFKQWKEAGCFVKEGEKGTMVTFVKKMQKETENPDTGESETQQWRLLRYYYVFNISQVDGKGLAKIQAKYKTTSPNQGLQDHARHALADEITAKTGAEIKYGGNVACYIHSPIDAIRMPKIGQFKDSASFYATQFHELTHWSGAEHRLDREKGKMFGDKKYAFEELVAEFGAAFLCARVGISAEPRPDHAQYLKNWAAGLKADKYAIFRAASAAQKATDYIYPPQDTEDDDGSD